MRALFVDDDENILRFYEQASLSSSPVPEIDMATNAEEALAKVVRTKYDLIILDVGMPGLSGLEIIGLVRNMCTHAVLAIISGQLDSLGTEAGGALDCADVALQKPVSLESVRHLVKVAHGISAHLLEIGDMESDYVRDLRRRGGSPLQEQ
jgi:DNA-binding response OmpR family regulator